MKRLSIATIATVLLAAQQPGLAAKAAPKPGAMTQPPAEMESVEKALGGKWNVTGNFEKSGEMPNGGPITGWQDWHIGPGGFTFSQEEDLHTPLGEIFGVGMMWWDKTKQSYGGLRCLNVDPRGCDVAAIPRVSIKWNGKELTVDFLSAKDPSKLSWHEVFSDITPQGFTQVGYSGDAEGRLTKTLTIHAARTH